MVEANRYQNEFKKKIFKIGCVWIVPEGDGSWARDQMSDRWANNGCRSTQRKKTDRRTYMNSIKEPPAHFFFFFFVLFFIFFFGTKSDIITIQAYRGAFQVSGPSREASPDSQCRGWKASRSKLEFQTSLCGHYFITPSSNSFCFCFGLVSNLLPMPSWSSVCYTL